MKTLSMDIECYSSVDLAKCGVYRYAEAEDFAITLFGYSIDGGEVTVIDLANGETLPQEIIDALIDEDVIKTAYHANFERVCLSRYLSDLGVLLDPFHDNHPLSTECARFLNPSSWRCTMVWAAYLGLPLSLAAVGMVLGLDEQKMTVAYLRNTFLPIISKNGNCSKPTTSVMLRWSLRYSGDWQNIPCRTLYGTNTALTKK